LPIRAGICLLTIVLWTPAPVRADLTQQYISLALQGDLRSASALFESVAPDSLTTKERALAEKFRTRFVLRTENPEPIQASPFVQEVLLVYRDYWTKVLMKDLTEAEGESHLRKGVRAALERRGIKEPIADDAPLDRLKQELEEEGLHVLGGVTRPYYDLMLWSFQESREYECELTDAVQRVEVVFIGDFLVMGWSHFATFGRAYTGGWATKENLYCLRDDYDVTTEKFKVSYLQHEARHFADYKLFPKLEQIDLEYRGKLTELAFADSSLQSLVQHFASSGALNVAAPHSYANYCVIRDLSLALFGEEVHDANDSRWTSTAEDKVHGAARALLEKSTQSLRAAGAESTRGIIRPPD